MNSSQINSRKTPFSSLISSQQFGSIHHSTPEVINNLNNTATNIWSNLLQSETSLDITFQITDLPTGHLAEATITGFDPFGRPNAGTILINYNANGVGWFIDSTPFESSEFAVQNSEFAYNATPNSDAYGKYDLLTTVLHEIAHLYGFIEGYEPFDHLHHDHATLHGEHLDNHAHPYDLLNTHLAPGIRKLPSDIDIEILKAILKAEGRGQKAEGSLEALLTSTPLLAAIANGNFNISDPYHPNFGWKTRGATTILNGQALLTEGSPFLSNLSQTFIIPEGAKTLQFTLVDAQLGTTQSFPSDAFEVALLDAHSLTSLVDTIDELSFTDAFFNLQNTGTTYLGNDIQLTHGTDNSPRTFSIDISHLTPGTEATLYFDLLGFGDNDSRVLIDDVIIQREISPITVNNPVTLTQGQSTVIQIFPDNSNLEEILQTYTIQIQTPAENGTVNIAENGTFIYTPKAGFVGTDTFTYILTDGNGTQTIPSTITVTVNNALPEIADIDIISEVIEGNKTVLRATATDAGGDTLTYIWELSDGTRLTGQVVTHSFPHNGTYTATLTVIDAHGERVTTSFELEITNIAPIVEPEDKPTISLASNTTTKLTRNNTETIPNLNIRSSFSETPLPINSLPFNNFVSVRIKDSLAPNNLASALNNNPN
ncbi:VCBS [Crocosphaera chwakensis CCY0110]|uniref:VCBS n=1 Tax=Crocosphaera chwakensis CCY0110 TaxID=391612 RepID=A3IQH0_9CHRO|nr:VCBS [Crocosphaera chwakensis CCY0110]